MVERLFTAYLSEGEALGDHGALVRLAAAEGLDAAGVRAMLASDRHAAAVRDDEARARRLGITSVPFFVLDGRLGVSGAQPPEVLRAALQEAWAQARPALRMVGDAAGPGEAGAGCGPDGCPT
jgi:predicted DsbA family dithiol-disulfide isomerase